LVQKNSQRFATPNGAAKMSYEIESNSLVGFKLAHYRVVVVILWSAFLP